MSDPSPCVSRPQEKVGVQAIVDIATLTGACIIALGGDIAGMFTPSDAAAANINAAAKASGEKVRQSVELP